MIHKSTKPKAPWTRAFPNQVKKLRPENTAKGGVKAHSGSKEARMAVYRPIAVLYKYFYPICVCCEKNATDDIHHIRGRNGLLLFDTRYFLAVCRKCHSIIHDHPAEARKFGLIETNKKACL